MSKTITYNPETHVLVPREPSEPFGYYENGRFSVITDGGPDKYRERKGYQGAIYTTPQPDRTAELEAETTKLKLDLLTSYGEAEELSGKVAELEAALKVARAGIDKFLVAKNSTEFDCACDLSVGYLCGPCHADKQQQPLKSALAKINEVLK